MATTQDRHARRRALAACTMTALVTACGGGGSNTAAPIVPPIQPPAVTQSAGGIWHAFTTDITSAMTLFVAESGTITLFADGPAFGKGALVVTSGTQVSGSFDLHTLQTSPSIPRVEDQHCQFTGGVQARASLALTIDCADAAGNTRSRSHSFIYDVQYDSDSSLELIAGNYTLPFNTSTNILTIGDDGTIFGRYHNGGFDCTVNGIAAVVDEDFALYEMSFSFASCQGIFDQYEGQTLTGLGLRDPPGAVPGSLLIMLGADIDGEFEMTTMLYDPV